ncbi:MAG: NADH-quinone oxidoreductase, subunit, partial [Planctomycetota bacterium]
ALACLGAEPFLGPDRKHRILPWTGALVLLAAIAAVLLAPLAGGTLHLDGLYALDPARRWLVAAVLAAGAVGLGGIQQSLSRDRFPGGEPYALALFAVAGAVLMVQACDALALFVGLEITSLAVYALVGLRRHRPESNEALFKYFVMGAVFSAVFLYGAALAYGATGSTRFGQVALDGRGQLWLLGHALMVIALLFKVGAVPFHSWAPDAYTGAPVAVTGLMGAIVKVGGFTALGALWLNMATALSGQSATALPLTATPALTEAARGILLPFSLVFVLLAVLSIAVGNLSALKQTSVRRIVAFSSIAHAGFMLFVFVLPAAGLDVGLQALWLYLIAYALATAATLTAVAGLAGGDDAHDDLASLAGQARLQPLHGITLTISLAATAGIPPTLGFLGKFAVLAGLVSTGSAWWPWAVAAMVLAVVGAIYYLRLIVALWVAEPKRPALAGDGLLATWGIVLAAAALIALVAIPNLIAPAA